MEKETQWVDQRFTENLIKEGIPSDKQELFYLLSLLPKWIHKNGEFYILHLYRDERWNAAYSTTSGLVLHTEVGRSMADAVGRLTVYLSERGELKKET